jgi:endogenous inhibitor of DNA gyrase (YacG/DUF329 family)
MRYKLGAADSAPHIPLMSHAPRGSRICPICGKPTDPLRKPFCSKRCADVDLHRWFSGAYAVPVTEDEEEDERRTEGGEEPN